MKRFAMCLIVAMCVVGRSAAAEDKRATCEKACSGTKKGCVVSCFKAAPCVNACTGCGQADRGLS